MFHGSSTKTIFKNLLVDKEQFELHFVEFNLFGVEGFRSRPLAFCLLGSRDEISVYFLTQSSACVRYIDSSSWAQMPTPRSTTIANKPVRRNSMNLGLLRMLTYPRLEKYPEICSRDPDERHEKYFLSTTAELDSEEYMAGLIVSKLKDKLGNMANGMAFN